MIWYEYKPTDTMFFRGAEPLAPGVSYDTVTLFPPPASVISGTMRTAWLSQNGVSIKEYRKGHEQADRVIGKFGTAAPFAVVGFVVKKGAELLLPAPYTWMTESKKDDTHIKIISASRLERDVQGHLGMHGSFKTLQWARHKKDLRSLGGGWVTIRAFVEGKTELQTGLDFFHGSTFFVDTEERTGIELDKSRKVKESRLYTSRHLRLAQDTTVIWAADRDIGLDDQGIFTLGGEQRFGGYQKIEVDILKKGNSGHHMALMPVEVSQESWAHLIAAGKIQYRGGWDLAKQFHRDMIGYYAPGAVFSSPVNNSCVAI